MAEEVYTPSTDLRAKLEIDQQAQHEAAQDRPAQLLPKLASDGFAIVDYDGPQKVHTRFKRSQIAEMDYKTYQQHRSDIVYALNNDLIDDDVTPEAVKAAEQKRRDDIAEAQKNPGGETELLRLKILSGRAKTDADEKYYAYKRVEREHAEWTAPGNDATVIDSHNAIVQAKRREWEEAVANSTDLEKRYVDFHAKLYSNPKPQA